MRYVLYAICAVLFLTGKALAQDSAAFLAPVHLTEAPWGFVDFCERYADECRTTATKPRRLVYDEKLQRMLGLVNREVNLSIKPVTDAVHWGVVERWDFAEDGKGDCDEYALVKRRELIAKGLPRETLLLTVVLNHGEGHLVLTVVTDHGHLILDNETNVVLPWHQTRYLFLKRQSQWNQTAWVSLGRAEARYASIKK